LGGFGFPDARGRRTAQSPVAYDRPGGRQFNSMFTPLNSVMNICRMPPLGETTGA
jgi:hypothetical protein